MVLNAYCPFCPPLILLAYRGCLGFYHPESVGVDFESENMVVKNEATVFDSLLEKVYRDTGHNFREYKRGTVTRRLERRLHATGAKTYLDYMEFLDAYPEEHYKLADDFTIKVSGFFRSSYTFQQIARLVLPDLTLFKRDRGERELRFWSTACARGEEPYSIAILLAQFLGNRRQPFANLDCIFGCNVLIYLQSQLQERVLSVFYDSLAAPGYLILGEVETLTSSLNGKLECLDARAKIYKKNRGE